MKKIEVVNLYNMIKDFKSGKMDKELLIAFIMLRLKLKEIFEEFEKVRTEIAEQTKPEGLKEGDDTSAWDEVFRPAMEAWLLTDVEGIDTKIFTIDQFAEFVTINDLTGIQQDILAGYFLVE